MIALTPEQIESVEHRFRLPSKQWAELTAYRSNIGGRVNETEREANWRLRAGVSHIRVPSIIGHGSASFVLTLSERTATHR